MEVSLPEEWSLQQRDCHAALAMTIEPRIKCGAAMTLQQRAMPLTQPSPAGGEGFYRWTGMVSGNLTWKVCSRARFHNGDSSMEEGSARRVRSAG